MSVFEGSPRRLADLVVVDAQGSAQPLEHACTFGMSACSIL